MRIGNGAFDQRQNDVYGAVLGSILLHTRRGQRLPARLWPIVESQADCALKVWREPTRASGKRAGRRSTTCPRSSCAGSRSTGPRSSPRSAATRELAQKWLAAAEEIRADILEHGVSERGVLRQHYATDALDASALLAAIFGFLPENDERLRKTVLAIAEELSENGSPPPNGGREQGLLGGGGDVPHLLVLARLWRWRSSARCGGPPT